MQRQKSRARNEVTEKYAAKKDKVWFPLTEDQLAEHGTLDLRKLFLEAGGSNDQPERILAIKASEFHSIFSIRDSFNIDDFLLRLFELPSLTPGIIIPTSLLDDSWFMPRTMDGSDVLALVARIATTVMHTTEPPPEILCTMGPLEALKVGCGNCFHFSSLLAGALRKNDIPARIVGNVHFFGEENGDHWWVETFIGDMWRHVDPYIAPELVAMMKKMAEEQGLVGDDALLFTFELLKKAAVNGLHLSPTLDPRYSEKVRERIIAAEIDH